MEQKYLHTLSGQEVHEDDINLVSDNASLADDRVLAELLRLAPFTAAPVAKAILPHAIEGPGDGTNDPNHPTARSTGLADATVNILPYRAIVGSRDTAASIGGKANWRDIRSGIFAGASSLGTPFQLPVTAADPRWDLIYSKVTVDKNDPAVTRNVRDGVTGVVSTPDLVITQQTTVETFVLNGAEAATPVRPAVPADSGDEFHIPIAYVLVVHPHTLTSIIPQDRIHEAHPIAGLARSVGMQSLEPARSLYDPAGAVEANTPWTTGNARPEAYLPPSMSGGASRLVAMKWDGSTQSHGLNVVTVLDDSIDWRNRLFKTKLVASDGAFIWQDGGGGVVPSHALNVEGTNKTDRMGQGFEDDGTAAVGTAGAIVARVTNAELSVIAAGAGITLFVDLADGKLKLLTGSTNPQVRLFAWVEASAPFGNFS